MLILNWDVVNCDFILIAGTQVLGVADVVLRYGKALRSVETTGKAFRSVETTRLRTIGTRSETTRLRSKPHNRPAW